MVDRMNIDDLTGPPCSNSGGVGSFLRQCANKLRSFFMRMAKDDIQWEELEAEIDAQVEAVFDVAEEMDSFTDADGITDEYKLKEEVFSRYKTIEDLNFKMEKQRELQTRGRYPKLLFLGIFIVSLVVTNYILPKSIQGARRTVNIANETVAIVRELVQLVLGGIGGNAMDPKEDSKTDANSNPHREL